VFEKGSMSVEASPKSTGRKPKKSGVVVPNAPRWHQRLGASLFYLLSRIYVMTLRMRWDDRSGDILKELVSPTIYCLWHNRLILCADVYQQNRRQKPSGGMAALVSASRDGAFLSAILERFGIHAVRGSSSRRGPQALLELTSWSERGFDLTITPDGPRGPCYIVQEGVMSLAQLTGRPIVPFSFYARRKIQLKSWDRFQIPLPFSRCDLSLGKPVHVPREATDAQREEIRKSLEQALKDISRD
jgi:hypothetical protein